MKRLNLNNETFRRILKEELAIVRNVINENYSADKIWSSMSEEDRENALLASDDDNGPDLADQYAIETVWDNIPADIQDTLDLSVYDTAKVEVLAKNDSIGRLNLRAITGMSSRDPKVKEIVDELLKRLGMQLVDELTKSQSTALLNAIHARERGVTKSWTPNNFGNIDPNTQGKLGS